MGGSFNPPTLAHYTLMREAIDALDAWKGFFVPVSDAYLKRKIRRCHPPVVLSPEMRVRMLQSMCTDNRMTVCEKEIGTVEARTMPTLMALKEEHPDAEIYFLLGADKLDLLTHLSCHRGFLDMFKVALYARDKAGITDMLKENDELSRYLHRIVLLPQPEGTDTVSSTKVRERMLEGEPCADMLCLGVWELFKEFSPADFPDTIDRFKGEDDFLSNRFACQFVWQGLRYGNAEAAFQSSKCADKRERKVFSNCSADKATLNGREIVPYTGWKNECLSIIESVLTAKFEQNPSLMKRLIETDNRLLINGNSKGETYWGVDLYTWEGENMLGKLLMKIRDKEITK
ncbi:MAG: NADAR domain-containing protein [Prevotellaceae bacterium]|nr:NADAR domain-containing protein [Prevotellaceae bacterium]